MRHQNLVRRQFQRFLGKELRDLPFETVLGSVVARDVQHSFGAAPGPHDPSGLWKFETHSRKHKMLFGFVPYGGDYGFFSIVFHGSYDMPPGRPGATIQIPVGTDRATLRGAGSELTLFHGGKVTVGQGRIARRLISNAALQHAPEAVLFLRVPGGLLGWPYAVGSTSDVGSLLDRLFVYSFAIEQAKRAMTRDPVEAKKRSARARAALPQLDEDFEDRGEAASANGGQGYGLTGAQRRSVELHAVEIVERHYRALGYSVRRRGKPYDLRCIKQGSVLDVEVKGTVSAGMSIELTANEVKHAREHPMALGVVSGVRLDGSDRPTGGSLRVVDPWHPWEHGLHPCRYVCSLDPQSGVVIARPMRARAE